ncbi:TolB family protein [Paenibacillus doosanensis]|uniref:TolB family protein n=1 Tax=Paenibacillus doosanensis TaxID=1229154 RepID=UPI0021805460|nr:translocation protein TolB [Paenibacillus doosanensis]
MKIQQKFLGKSLFVWKRLFCLLVAVFLTAGFCGESYADPESAPVHPVKAAFVRKGNLWIKAGTEEKQLTDLGGVSGPKWSYDGQWIAYNRSQNGSDQEVWLYNAKDGRHEQIYARGGTNLQWSPVRNMLAFQDQTVLNITDTDVLPQQHFDNVALGVNNYSWLPDGSGFLASTAADRLPDGWTNPVLYLIPYDAKMDEKKMKRFFTIPSELTGGSVTVLSIGTSIFKWSADRRWISFVVHPTASWSADSDMLCLLSADGKHFKPVNEMLANSGWFKWAPARSRLAYIQGGGRMALENKHLKVKEVPALQLPALTPKGYADVGFTWVTSEKLVVSRSAESTWQQDPSQRPLPALVQLHLQDPQQQPVSSPPAGYGDYAPQYLKSSRRLGWVRSNREKAGVMLGKDNGAEAVLWIESVDLGSNYYEQWDWSEVLCWYDGTSS